jgi:tetratricopeptide (TPR) repeat protein
MKKKVSLIVAVFTGFVFFTAKAQDNKVVSAFSYLNDYIRDPTDTASLKNAKEAIDLAAANDKTKDEPRMFLYRGNIYRSIFERNLAVAIKKLMPQGAAKVSPQDVMKLKTQAYASIDTTPICIASYSYMRVIQLEPKKAYADDSRQMLPVCAAHIENQATSYYDQKNFATAFGLFQKSIVIGTAQGLKDTAEFMVQNFQNCAITADKIHDHNNAIFYYQKLTNLKVGGSQPYTALIAIYNDMKDTAKASDMMRQGRAAYPQDVNLLIAETNNYLQSGKTDKAIGNLQAAINKLVMDNKPEQNTLLSNLYFVLGNTYDRMANPKDDSGKSLAKPANYDDLFGKAEDNYKKAVALTPDNFDEEYDFGALYNNRASELNKMANAVPPSDNTGKYQKFLDQANDYLKKAQPPLEKAHALNPNDKATVHALMQIYASTGQTDKVQALKAGK